ncbi:MAG: hypothetical protein D6696_11815 [Acidobacteria bacterium]|nr:MAG: hypothetical protein D6696_11815 [Acidobacteriota bacterium]
MYMRSVTMRHLGRFVPLLLLVAVFARPAYAYLDPTSGSMFLQMIVGGIAGVAVALKLYWHRILGFFSGGRRQNDEPPA